MDTNVKQLMIQCEPHLASPKGGSVVRTREMQSNVTAKMVRGIRASKLVELAKNL